MRRRQFLKQSAFWLCLSQPVLGFLSKAQALSADFSEFLFLPGSKKFAELKSVINKLLILDDPDAILQSDQAEEIQRAVKQSTSWGLPVRMRSGGHSFEGFAIGKGLVVDVRKLKSIEINRDQGWVKVGAGVTLGELSFTLDQQGLGFPTGNCPTVGIAGYLLGGGHSRKSRLWGLGADRVQAMDVILANGESLTVSPSNHQDLYWALLGGGGGNFGIVTNFYLDLIPQSKDIYFSLSAKDIDYSQLISDWEEFIKVAPKEISPTLYISFSKGKVTGARMSGYLSVPSDSDVDPKLGFENVVPLNIREYFEGGRIKIKFRSPIQPPNDLETTTKFKGTSQYADKPIGSNGFSAIEEVINKELKNSVGSLEFIPLGGKILSPSRENSYPHRNSLYTMGIFVLVQKFSEKQQHFEATSRFHSQIDPLFSGRHYINYPDFSLENWAHRYYGESLEKLMEVKTKYDSGGIFDFGDHSLSSRLKISDL